MLGDHGCPRDSVCLYTTTDDYQNSRPDVIDDQALRTDRAYRIPAGGYAEVVNNTGPIPQYSAEGTTVLGLLGVCVFLPAATEAPGTDTPTTLSADTIVTGPDEASVGLLGSLIVPCPTP